MRRGYRGRHRGRLFTRPAPAGLHPFRAVEGAVHTAIATPGDLLFHLRARRADLCFELAAQLVARLRAQVEVIDEVHGFRYFDERDLLGFVDGTENPTGVDAEAAVFIGEEDRDFAGGSYVVVQKYLHDLAAWTAQPVEEQERAIGRHKLSDIEMSDGEKPTNAHVSLTTVVDEHGVQRQILRDNLPFGRIGTGELGTYFVGYASGPEVIEEMLRNMFIGKPPGNHDRVLDFSTAVTGSLFYVPTVDFLDDPGGGDSPATDTGATGPYPRDTPSATPPDLSLGIGSLKGQNWS